MKYVKKTSITKRNIKNSFISLLGKNKFDLITINQIVEEAEITRSTFYRYYEDKYELLSEIENEILNIIIEERRKIDEKFSDRDMFNIEIFTQLFDALEPYSKTIYYLLSHNGDASFEMKLKNEIKKRFADLKEMSHVSNTRSELIQEYIYVILVKTLQYWSANQKHIDIEEIASILQDIQLKGLRKTIDL